LEPPEDFSLKRIFPTAVALLVLLATPAFAQIDIDVDCNAGLRPDGFVDFSALPTAPNFPAGSSQSAPFTTTLPVTGVPGLTVQLTIPALNGSGGGPIYSVTGSTLALLGQPATAGGVLSLQFSTQVAGVGLIGQSSGREESYTLQIGPLSTDSAPPNFQNNATNFTEALQIFSTPLQAVDLANGFTTASLLFAPSTYGAPAISNLRVQSMAVASSPLVPTQGLQQWLRSESVTSPFAGTATVWPDQSGNGHDATAPTTPGQSGPFQVQEDGNTCKGAFSFTNNAYFNFNLPIDGWDQMTIFLVGKSNQDPPAGSSTSMAAAILWNENAPWGNTFLSPFQKDVAFRFGTTQPGNQPIYTRPTTIGGDFTVTRAVHDRTTDSLYVDGLRVLTQTGKNPVLSGTSGDGYIGRGINNTYFNGEINEILVYNRVLSADEAASVEKYLRNKFGTQ
jgi:hypothetical protein